MVNDLSFFHLETSAALHWTWSISTFAMHPIISCTHCQILKLYFINFQIMPTCCQSGEDILHLSVFIRFIKLQSDV